MRIIKDTKINFMSQQKLTTLLSAFLIIAGVISLAVNGGPKLSIDFKGGTMVSVQYTEAMDVTVVRTAMGNVNIDGQSFDFSREEIKHFGGSAAISVRVPHIENAPNNFAQKIVDHLYNAFPGKVPENKTDFILGKGTVGPKIGSELSGKAIMAIISALGLILLYISIRFEFRFALGAIAALAHDVLITLGIFSLMGYEISLPIIAAFLTIVGYSLNDTIVIFDRIRENVKASKKETYNLIVNQSINDSLSRTIITSLTTFMVVFVLWLFGGEVIHNFALAMIIGVIVGTYSSIFIASPIVVHLHENATK
ncbi:MAG: protein translocase subunit SecF [Candidatus Marinimicrobia bacterium]|jgi:preprotein translocase SecF subunit|nr:protein translocase subunit SecF [Candidatus Neomarinimicrobiota bacterium]MBT3676456.1 protein translocase subunit SecF [Candidatus Neomarinimicrobiota bacterium]MBT3762859.1 protein translocase subunit SecF [Candidatus Neomarinimicrobiota bacterium]MBT4067875.1 protein translocase subunit SecF [Candidatus Neomarinimicrobiota bacterium]MBT4269861.1 protein translocase subunit SecF [Candidatus Neomarinimicrobiota bacterium]